MCNIKNYLYYKEINSDDGHFGEVSIYASTLHSRIRIYKFIYTIPDTFQENFSQLIFKIIKINLISNLDFPIIAQLLYE